MISIVCIPVTPLAQNARLLFNESLDAVLVDPGGDVPLLEEVIEKLGVRVSHIVLTHAHLDHAGGVAASLECFADASGRKPQLLAYGADAQLRSVVSDQAVFYGFSPEEYRNVPDPDISLSDGQSVEMLGQSFKVLFTPGHAPDHVALYCESIPYRQAVLNGTAISAWSEHSEPILLAGDTLFQGSIGRTDLPRGSFPELEKSIREKLYVLPDETRVLSGHGPDTYIGFEKTNNAFVRPL